MKYSLKDKLKAIHAAIAMAAADDDLDIDSKTSLVSVLTSIMNDMSPEGVYSKAAVLDAIASCIHTENNDGHLTCTIGQGDLLNILGVNARLLVGELGECGTSFGIRSVQSTIER